MRLRVQVTDGYRKSRKTKVTSLVMKLFLDFLGVSRACATIVFSLSEFGYYESLRFFYFSELPYQSFKHSDTIYSL